MSEARVHWHYTCPICEERFSYAFTSGRPIKECPKCKVKELKRRASKMFTNPKDALVAFKELKKVMGYVNG